MYRVRETTLDYLVPYKKNSYDQEMKDAVMRILDLGASTWGWSSRGREITFFEAEFANYCNKKCAVLLDSTLHSLYLVLQLQGIGKGDEIMMAPHVEPANPAVAVQLGAKPVLTDIEEDTLTMNVDELEKKITNKTKAILPIHAHGHPTDMDPVMEVAEKHGLYVLEDSTHALGARYKGKSLPIGHAGVFSLSVKAMWLPGGPAMLVTDDKELADKLKLMRSWDGRRHPDLVKDANGKGITHSFKSVPADLDAAVGRVQLKHLDEYVTTQRKNANMYGELMKGAPITLPVEKDYARHTFLRYLIRTDKRDALREHLRQLGISCHGPLYQPAYTYDYYQKVMGYSSKDFPVSDRMSKIELALPEPTRDRTAWEIEYVAKNVKEFFN